MSNRSTVYSNLVLSLTRVLENVVDILDTEEIDEAIEEALDEAYAGDGPLLDEEWEDL